MNLNYKVSQYQSQLPGRPMNFPVAPLIEPSPFHNAEKYRQGCEASDRGTSENNDHVPSILSGQEKVDFLRKCCASPILRYILHLLSDRRQESLCSWYGGPFGVKIWNTRKFTESYNAAMGTKMNFTNISRALQACEHITMAAVRLWKRLKQGEYSFFPNYTGHGLPQIPLSAMPRDVPPRFPFERIGILKSSQSHSGEGYEHSSTPARYYDRLSYRTPPCSESRSHHTRFQPYLTPCSTISSPPFPSPAPSVSPQSYDSPEMPFEYSIASPGYVPIPCSILTPPPSDNSSTVSDSFCSNDSLLTQPYSPAFAEPPQQPDAGTPPTVIEESPSRAPPQDDNHVEHHFDPSVLTEFLLPLEDPVTCSQPPASPVAPTTPMAIESDLFPSATFLKSYSDLGEQDIFGNTSSISGYDLTIDETSLLYH